MRISRRPGELCFAWEYGQKTNATAGNNAVLGWMSKDFGQKWVQVWNVLGTPGPNISNWVSGGYHCHGVAIDPWNGGRIWSSHGDNMQGIWYSDDLPNLQIWEDLTTANASTALTGSSSNNYFSSADVGAAVWGTNIPAGTTIQSVTNAYTAVLNQAATGASSSLPIGVGPITWTKFHFFESGRWQTVGIIPAPDAVYFGSDGYPTGINRSRRGVGNHGNAQSRIESLLQTAAYETGTGHLLTTGQFRAQKLADAPIVFGFTPNDTATGGAIALVHPSGRKAWTVWTGDTTLHGASTLPLGVEQVFYTANGNIVANLCGFISSATVSQATFKMPMPILPSASAL